MKSVVLSLALVFGVSATVFAEAETKRVCIDVKDKDGKIAKDGKGNPKQSCKDVKQHKKLEGTAVPEKK
jgi:hypothetical protein